MPEFFKKRVVMLDPFRDLGQGFPFSHFPQPLPLVLVETGRVFGIAAVGDEDQTEGQIRVTAAVSGGFTKGNAGFFHLTHFYPPFNTSEAPPQNGISTAGANRSKLSL
jgi:hypothetical protein